jgi:CRP/FNR family transcriptional regulator, dissimilatory nitrate respiration regulator
MDPGVAIAQSRFFEGLSPESRRRLAGLCFVREVKKGVVLFAEGDEGHSIYLCARGGIQLHKTSPEGREVVIHGVRPGDIFAEVILFEQNRYPVTAVTLADSTVVAFPRREIHRLLAGEEFRNDFMASLMRKLRYLTGRIVELTATDARERLRGFLEQRAPAGTTTVALRMTKKDVAAAIGTTPETLSRLIRRLTDEGTLCWRGRTVSWRR